MKRRLKKVLQCFLNPRLLLCLGMAWMITNGWSYVLFGIGAYFGITWMTAVAGAYLAFLWLPISPEKIVTFAIALALMRWFFPKDEKTLAFLRDLHQKAKNTVKRKKKERQEKHSAESDQDTQNP